MIEQVIQGILLAFHNIALVGCAAAPFYNRNLVRARSQYGAKLHYELDKVVEDTLQGNAPYCLAFLAVLVVTGIGMPLNHLLFHGVFKTLHAVAIIALVLKLSFITGMVVIMMQIFFGLNPRLKELLARFTPNQEPAVEEAKEFFAKRARRKALCETCLKFAIGILVCSAFLGFGS
jgi:hypothetical protein